MIPTAKNIPSAYVLVFKCHPPMKGPGLLGVGVQNEPPQGMPLRYEDYFELKITLARLSRQTSAPPLRT